MLLAQTLTGKLHPGKAQHTCTQPVNTAHPYLCSGCIACHHQLYLGIHHSHFTAIYDNFALAAVPQKAKCCITCMGGSLPCSLPCCGLWLWTACTGFIAGQYLIHALGGVQALSKLAQSSTWKSWPGTQAREAGQPPTDMPKETKRCNPAQAWLYTFSSSNIQLQFLGAPS